MSSANDRGAEVRIRIEQHWAASERGGTEAEHAMAPTGRAALAESILARARS
jgi:hypothetical protein